VPETAIDKERQPNGGENEVWFAEKWDVTTPTSDFVMAKYSD